MTKKLVVVADLGHLKVYRWEESRQFSKPRLKLVEEWDTHVADHLSEAVTDQAGRYRKGSAAGPSNLSDGEEHNLHLERRKRALKSLGEHVNELASRDNVEGIYLSAGEEINRALMETLDARTRSMIEKNLALNLTKVNPDEVIAHFSE